jgi:hypothetical protein
MLEGAPSADRIVVVEIPRHRHASSITQQHIRPHGRSGFRQPGFG